MATVTVLLEGRQADPARARLVAADLVVVLPVWPDGIEFTGAADSWEQQGRPGRMPLLRRTGLALPTVRVDDLPVGVGPLTRSCLPTISALRRLARMRTPARLWTAGADRGRWRVTELGWTETDWAPSGQPSRATVSMTLTAASDPAVPVGPVRALVPLVRAQPAPLVRV